MNFGVRWLAVWAFIAMMAVSPALAADGLAPSTRNVLLTVRASGVVPAPALAPAASEDAVASMTQLQPVRFARAPYSTLSTATLLSAGSQPIGFQVSGQRAGGGMSRHIHWAILGAAIGAIIGAVDDDPLGKALIGGAVGFGLSYVVRR